MRMRGERLRVFTGTAHPALAQDICSFMGVVYSLKRKRSVRIVSPLPKRPIAASFPASDGSRSRGTKLVPCTCPGTGRPASSHSDG